MKREKRIVVRDAEGRVVHIGPWDYQTEHVERTRLDALGRPMRDEDGAKLIERLPVVRNPKPDGFTECEADCVQLDDGGWYACEDHTAPRRASYPTIADQLDAIWKGGEAAVAMRARVLAVKASFPKQADNP